MSHQASCHCGDLAFEVQGEISEVMRCNCSICSRKGALLWFVPAAAVRWSSGAERAANYQFGAHRVRHRFCPRCGIHLCGEVQGPDGPLVAVNVRCIDGLPLDTVKVRDYDGRAD
ncbi:GFA family protein [Niveibacterium sp. SC-1]|uniref:GFA family protein n=1 Tax=Niveibacterium sp. SC-1 TaxID=3135646 RepID=UPI00311F66A6